DKSSGNLFHQYPRLIAHRPQFLKSLLEDCSTTSEDALAPGFAGREEDRTKSLLGRVVESTAAMVMPAILFAESVEYFEWVVGTEFLHEEAGVRGGKRAGEESVMAAAKLIGRHAFWLKGNDVRTQHAS